MKFAMKTLVAAAAIAAFGVANAASVGTPVQFGANTVTLTGGTGALSFSPGSGFDGTDPSTIGGLIGALNVGKITIAGVGGATYNEQTIEDEFGDIIRVGATANAGVVGLNINGTGQITEVLSTGGAAQTGTRISGTLNGGTASVTNLRFDLVNNVVYADLIGRSAAVGTRPAVDYQLLNQALWTIGNVTGPTSLPTSIGGTQDTSVIAAQLTAAGYTVNGTTATTVDVTATNRISGLKVTTEGYNFFANSLGLLSTGRDALSAVNNDSLGWGEVNSTINFTVTTVPEPSTYAMGIMGLAVVGALARRRRAAK